MNILITGSAGFVGRSLVPYLQKLGHFVIGIDLKPDLQSDLFFQKDIRDGIPKINLKIDYCIHLASSVGGFLHNILTQDLEKYELDLLQSVRQFLSDYSYPRVIYFSTINVFERSLTYLHAPLSHQYQSTSYARAKRKGEEFVQHHFNEFVIIRPTNIFGKDQRVESYQIGYSHVIPELIKKIKTENVIEVLGDGSQLRNFIHISDVCSYVELLLKNFKKDWVNLRSDLFLSISELAQYLRHFYSPHKPIRYRSEFLNFEPYSIQRFSIQKLNGVGWVPKIDQLERGLML